MAVVVFSFEVVVPVEQDGLNHVPESLAAAANVREGYLVLAALNYIIPFGGYHTVDSAVEAKRATDGRDDFGRKAQDASGVALTAVFRACR